MRHIKYKQRSETKSITVVYEDMKGQPFNIVYRNSLRKGEFDTGYHFYIDAECTLSADREITSVAQHDFKNNDTSIYVLIDTVTIRDTNDTQRKILNELLVYIKETYGNLDLITLVKD